ncbi:hypothetical protein LR48_Vigan382s000100 [Vigna angularis]|uniref:Uncharacterized protein n=1 Tax=Phaseolus angularis TaxID=3914 RepID=A0A0L9T903_PHAAN|nr:hypothetical protein LR48_Vigan382s000100 [Vigna angularis]
MNFNDCETKRFSLLHSIHLTPLSPIDSFLVACIRSTATRAVPSRDSISIASISSIRVRTYVFSLESSSTTHLILINQPPRDSLHQNLKTFTSAQSTESHIHLCFTTILHRLDPFSPTKITSPSLKPLPHQTLGFQPNKPRISGLFLAVHPRIQILGFLTTSVSSAASRSSSRANPYFSTFPDSAQAVIYHVVFRA